ncbi:acetamidase/formamidase family protein [Bradyrhizobium sp. 150]|nr:acetamidase/formamidase family protein [Bradyrhizobium sp. 150]
MVVDFGGHLKPELRVEPHETFVIETRENLWDLLGEPNTVLDLTHPQIRARQYPRVNPVTGPVYLNGADPGDTIVVNLEKIDVRGWGWTGTAHGMGRLTGLSYLADIDVNFSTVIRHVPGPSGTCRRRSCDEFREGGSVASRAFCGNIPYRTGKGNRKYFEIPRTLGR